jgi:hypothetical protein
VQQNVEARDRIDLSLMGVCSYDPRPIKPSIAQVPIEALLAGIGGIAPVDVELGKEALPALSR